MLADENKVFDYSKFRYVTIRKIFDFLHGVDFEDVELSIGLEILAWTNFDGQVDQKSDTETVIFNEFSKQLKAFKVCILQNNDHIIYNNLYNINYFVNKKLSLIRGSLRWHGFICKRWETQQSAL